MQFVFENNMKPQNVMYTIMTSRSNDVNPCRSIWFPMVFTVRWLHRSRDYSP